MYAGAESSMAIIYSANAIQYACTEYKRWSLCIRDRGFSLRHDILTSHIIGRIFYTSL
jgi:hypothetical protein